MPKSVNPITAQTLERFADRHHLRITYMITQGMLQILLRPTTSDVLMDLAVLLDIYCYTITHIRHNSDDEYTDIIATRKA